MVALRLRSGNPFHRATSNAPSTDDFRCAELATPCAQEVLIWEEVVSYTHCGMANSSIDFKNYVRHILDYRAHVLTIYGSLNVICTGTGGVANLRRANQRSPRTHIFRYCSSFRRVRALVTIGRVWPVAPSLEGDDCMNGAGPRGEKAGTAYKGSQLRSCRDRNLNCSTSTSRTNRCRASGSGEYRVRSRPR